METVAVTASVHKTTCKFVNDYDFALLIYDIILIEFHYIVGAEGVVYIMVKLDILYVRKVVDREETLGFRYAVFGKRNRLFLLVEVDIVRFKRLCEAVSHDVHFAGLAAAAGNNKRGTGFVDKNRVYLVDNTEVKRTLNFVALINNHIVAKVIETELVIRSVSYIAVVCGALCVVIHARDRNAYGEPEETVNFAHPFRVAACEVIVYRNDVNALACKRVKIGRQSRNERFTFTCSHLRDTPLMKGDTADKLDVEMSHSEHAPACLANGGESFGKNIVERFVIVFKTVFEFGCFRFKLFVGEFFVLLFVFFDFIGDCVKLFDMPAIVAARNK